VKRVLAIILTVVFLFNVIGYYGVYVAMLRQAHLTLNQQIDNNNYKAEQTITIRIPLTLPYPTQENDFQRVQGDFEHQGEFYKLVKQKYSNDTLYVVCIKNTEQKKAFKVFSDFVKLSTDQSSSNNHGAKTVVSLIKDYSSVVTNIQFAPRESINLAKSFSLVNTDILAQNFPVISPPPRTAC